MKLTKYEATPRDVRVDQIERARFSWCWCRMWCGYLFAVLEMLAELMIQEGEFQDSRCNRLWIIALCLPCWGVQVVRAIAMTQGCLPKIGHPLWVWHIKGTRSVPNGSCWSIAHSCNKNFPRRGETTHEYHCSEFILDCRPLWRNLGA